MFSKHCALLLVSAPRLGLEGVPPPLENYSARRRGPEFFNHYKNDLERHAHIPRRVSPARTYEEKEEEEEQGLLSRFLRGID